MGDRRFAHRVLVGKPEENKPPGKPRRRWDDNTNISPRSGMCCMDWIELALDRDRWLVLVNAVMNLRVP
jgi:hypothetical protein